MSSDLVAETLDIVRQGRPLHSLEAEFTLQTLGQRAAPGIERCLGAAHREGQPLGTRGAERGAAGRRARMPRTCCSQATYCWRSTTSRSRSFATSNSRWPTRR